MKRSQALTPLSRDHHQALAAALRLRRADEDDLEAARERFARFWPIGRRHFDIEERLLVPALGPEVAGWTDGCARMLREHADLRARADELLAAPTVAAAHELGTRLDAHVRFEERELFGLLEAHLPPAKLDALGRAVAAAEAEPV